MKWIEDFLDQAKQAHVFVIGDLMLDRYLWGSVDRISPEAPVPIMTLKESDSRLGGAANVALNLASLGASVSVFGVVGNDSNGEVLKNLCIGMGMSDSGITTMDLVPTTTKTRVIAGHQHLLRVDDEQHLNLNDTQQQSFIDSVVHAMQTQSPQAIVLQDYNKGLLSKRVIEQIIEHADKMHIPVSVDPKQDNFFSFDGTTLFKPNRRELNAHFSYEITPDIEVLDRAAKELREKMAVKILAVTLSEHGIYINDGADSGIFPTLSQEVIDVCGAGDAVVCVLTLANLQGFSLEQMAHLSNLTGSAVCSQVGVAPVTPVMLSGGYGVETFS